MRLTVAHTGAEGDQRMIEHGAVGFRRIAKLLEERREQRGEIRVDARVLLHLFGLTGVMRDVMVRFLEPQRRIRSLAGFAARHEGKDAGEVGLPGHHEQIEH